MRLVVWVCCAVVVVLVVLVVRWCYRAPPPPPPLLSATFETDEVLVVCTDATHYGAQFCEHVVARAADPGRIRIGLVQRRAPGSQNVAEALRVWHRQDIVRRTRVTVVDASATLAEALCAAARDLHEDEPVVVLLSPMVRLAQDWDAAIAKLPTRGLRVHGTALVRRRMRDLPAFPVVYEVVRGVPAFRYRAAAQPGFLEASTIPLSAITPDCLVLPAPAFGVLVAGLGDAVVPDWALPAVGTSVLRAAAYRILGCAGIIKELDLSRRPAAPADRAWNPAQVRGLISQAYRTYARVDDPRGRLGVTDGATAVEWRCKWGDSNAQDAARERYGDVAPPGQRSSQAHPADASPPSASSR